jgi:hypothetical protein
MASFYVPLCVMVVVYVKILRVVADKKKQMTWKHPNLRRNSSTTTNPPTSHPTILGGNKKSSSLASSQFVRNSALQNGVTVPLLQQAMANNNVMQNDISVTAKGTKITTSIVPSSDKCKSDSTANNNPAYFFPTNTLRRIKKGK